MAVWTDAFIYTDDARLNRQFISFFRLISGLRLHAYTSSEIHQQFLKIEDFAPCHFRYEEEVMRQQRYPFIQRHAEVHHFLLNQVASVLRLDVPTAYLGMVQACAVACLENHLYIDDPEAIQYIVRVDDHLFEN